MRKVNRVFVFSFLAILGLSIGHLVAQQGILFHPNPFPDRYFFGATGFGLPPGDRTYENTLLAFNQISFGKENGKLYALGMVPTFLTGSVDYVPIWLTASKRFYPKNSSITPYIGANFLKLPKEAENDAWMFYGGITFGTPEKNINTGIFIAGWGKGEPPVMGMMLHGLARAGRRAWVVSENYLVAYHQHIIPISLLGLRKQRKKMALEAGMGWFKMPSTLRSELATQNGRYGAFPWLSVQVKLQHLPMVQPTE